MHPGEAWCGALLAYGRTKLRYDMGLPTDPCHPWSFAMAQSAIAVADHELAAAAVPVTAAEVRDDLLKLFGSVPDGRSGQGRDHPVGAVLALAAAAVAAGMKGGERRKRGWEAGGRCGGSWPTGA